MAAETDLAAGNDTTIEALVVTARRRSEALQDVPVTVTAVTGDQLRESGISELRDVMALVPNAVIQDNPESFNTFVNIRGMRNVDVQAEPGVGLYRNGMYIGGHRANLGAQVDVDRIEILRGPQGGFYGRSSVGGTVDIIYATPSRSFGGYAKASYGSHNRTEVQGAVNLPIGDNSALRLTAWSFNQTKSDLYNETLDEYVGAYTDHGFRIGYSVDLTDRLDVLWMIESQEGTGPSLKTYAPFGVSNFGAMSPPETIGRIRRDTRSKADKQQLYFAQAINYRSDYGDLTLNASYRKYDLKAVQDQDQTALGPEQSPLARQTAMLRDEGTKDYFVEALWASPSEGDFSWMVGASYFKERFDFARTITSRRVAPGFGVQTAIIGFPNAGTAIRTETVSMFGTINYNLSDQLSVEASLRYSNDKKSLTYSQGVLPTGTGDTALDAYFKTVLGGPYPTYAFGSTGEYKNWSPSLTARYKFSDDVMGYATYSTGFRPGAFNLSPTTPETIPYGQETARNYEVGMKGSFFDRRLQANLAAFYMRQEDLLLALSTSLGGVDRTYLTNVGSGDTYGVEFEGVLRANDWISLGLGVGWLSPKFDEAVSSDQDLSGKLIPFNRKWTINARIDANYPISGAVDLVGSASVRYETGGLLGDYYMLDPYKPLTKVDGYGGVEINGSTRVTAFVQNLLDERIPLFWYYNGATNTSPGRTVGLDITHKF